MADVDVGMLLRLQTKVKDLEQERSRLRERLEGLEEDSTRGSVIGDSAFESLKVRFDVNFFCLSMIVVW